MFQDKESKAFYGNYSPEMKNGHTLRVRKSKINGWSGQPKTGTPKLIVFGKTYYSAFGRINRANCITSFLIREKVLPEKLLSFTELVLGKKSKERVHISGMVLHQSLGTPAALNVIKVSKYSKTQKKKYSW